MASHPTSRLNAVPNRLLLIVAAWAVAGCASLPPAGRLDQLVERTRALEADVAQNRSVTAAQQRQFDRLLADIQTYNAATGRHDASVERATLVTPCGPGPAPEPAFSALQPEHPTCSANCPFFPPNRPKGYFCLPDGASYCDPLSGVTVCSYRCAKIPFAGILGAAGAAHADARNAAPGSR